MDRAAVMHPQTTRRRLLMAHSDDIDADTLEHRPHLIKKIRIMPNCYVEFLNVPKEHYQK